MEVRGFVTFSAKVAFSVCGQIWQIFWWTYDLRSSYQCTKFLVIWSTESWETQLLKEKNTKPWTSIWRPNYVQHKCDVGKRPKDDSGTVYSMADGCNIFDVMSFKAESLTVYVNVMCNWCNGRLIDLWSCNTRNLMYFATRVRTYATVRLNHS